jgi:hypothetical protein
MDFQRLMLVSVRDPSGWNVWLWLEDSPTDVRWSALRQAVVASRRAMPGNAVRVARVTGKHL